MKKEQLLKIAEDDLQKKIIFFANYQTKFNNLNTTSNQENINELILDIKNLDLLIEKLKTNVKENKTLWSFAEDEIKNSKIWTYFYLSSNILNVFINLIFFQITMRKKSILYILKEMREEFINNQLFEKYDFSDVFFFIQGNVFKKIFSLSDRNFLEIADKGINKIENELSNSINFNIYYSKLSVFSLLLIPILWKASIITYKYFLYTWSEFNVWKNKYVKNLEKTIKNKNKLFKYLIDEDKELETNNRLFKQKQFVEEEFYDALDNQPWFNVEEINSIDLQNHPTINRDKPKLPKI